MIAKIKDAQRSLNIAGSVIAVGLILLLGFVTWALVYHEISEKNATVFSTVLGIISTQLSMVVAFYFGSSMSDKKNADTISTMATTAAATQTASLATPPPAPPSPGSNAQPAPGPLPASGDST